MAAIRKRSRARWPGSGSTSPSPRRPRRGWTWKRGASSPWSARRSTTTTPRTRSTGSAPRFRCTLALVSLVHPLAPVLVVVHEEVGAQVLQIREIGAAFVELGEALDEPDQVGILRHHEGGDRNPLAAALHGLVQGLVHDLGIEAERVLVEPSPLHHGRGLPVGDHEDLLVHVL